ncbi:MAG TPA: tocopherol cyclase family protein [Coriobacteriia bacterium]|nr:tocopherol cyclase family protein [Coriobacteriia bacterium]
MPGLRRIWNPAEYQGGRVSRRYFEGWYFKQVDATGQRVVAVIPGVSYSADGSSSHAFVQVVPAGGEMHYFAYPIEEFGFDAKAPFGVNVGPNTFSCTRMVLDLDDGERRVRGELSFGSMSPWPVTAFSPGIMGWYRFVPGMETYHGVISMDHGLSGWIDIDGDRTDFGGGRGYIEKDWGRSFPSSWVWAQSNHFGREGISLSLSVAKVPWMTGAFVGHIAGLLLDGKLHRFATYTGAKPTCIETGKNEAHFTLADKHEELDVHVRGCEALILTSPVLGAMEGRDAESLGGTIDVTLRSLRGGRAPAVFQGTGTAAAIEVMNDKKELGHIPCGETREGSRR